MLVQILTASPHMKSFDFLIMPACAGLIAGIAHGIITHQAGLPIGFIEQVQQIFEGENISLQPSSERIRKF